MNLIFFLQFYWILLTVSIYINSSNWKCIRKIELDTVLRNSYSEVFFRKGVLKISSKFTGEHPWRSAYFQNTSSTEHLWMAASVFWYALCQIPDFLTLRVLSYGLTDMLCTSNSFPFWMVHLGQCYQLHRLWVSTDVCVLLVYILYFAPFSSLSSTILLNTSFKSISKHRRICVITLLLIEMAMRINLW